jgi:hypothetical protein
MRRGARVTDYSGRGDGGFYVEDPDIPEGLTCQDWRQRRARARRSERWEWLRRAKIQPGTAFRAPAFGGKP